MATSLGGSPESQIGLDWASLKWLLLYSVSVQVKFCMCPFRVECLLQPLSLPYANSTGIQGQIFGGLLLGQDPWAGSDPLLLRGNLYNCDYPPLCGSPPRWCKPCLYHISDPIIHLCGSFFTSLCFLASF